MAVLKTMYETKNNTFTIRATNSTLLKRIAFRLALLFSVSTAMAAPLATPQVAAQPNSLRLLPQKISQTPSAQKLELIAEYTRKEELYLSKATAQKKVFDQRLSASYVFPKTPTPMDTARNLLYYYQNQADHYAALAQQLRQP